MKPRERINKVMTAMRLDPKLLADLRKFSRKDRRTVTAVVERAVRAYIYRKAA